MPVSRLESDVTGETHRGFQTLLARSLPLVLVEILLRLLLCLRLKVKPHLFLKFGECVMLVLECRLISSYGRVDLAHSISTLARLSHGHLP